MWASFWAHRLIQCTCLPNICTCMAQLLPDTIWILGAPMDSYAPIPPYPSHTIQFREFTLCHKRFPDNSMREKSNKYNPHITITTWVCGVLSKRSLDVPKNLDIPPQEVKKLKKYLHQIAIKYLACTFISLFSHVGRFHDPRICQLYSMGPSNKVGIFVDISYVQAKLGILGGVILRALCAWIIVHPNNISTKH